ncbi:Protein claret segregational [Eumeta japonica]|uniref:Protein claret segregational n=1 Tax=Eumeta variegata TaxID=151549 RepID=A0A4C1VH39_EUMVA|nr:Protein claret segregational [Eumeta japonica]
MALKEETEALRTLNDHLKKISVEHDQLQIEHKQAQEIITGNKVELEDLQSMLAAMYKEQRDLRNTVQDLKEPSKDQENHDIKMVNSKGIDVYVSNLKEEEVKSSYDFTRLMISAQRNRQTAATLNNERSSRSHAVTQIKISAINEKRKEKFTSNLNLVDLAGSESGKFSQRMDETKHINRSLSELSKVILSLQTNQAHIPYRNSKLTHLLMPSLGGNSKTLMLVNVNQFDECFSETLNSLRFATKVNSCRTVKAKKNITMVDS